MEVNIHEAKTNLSRLILKAEAGEEVIIARAGKAVVKLVPVERADLKMYKPGALKGHLHLPSHLLEPDSALDGSIEQLFYQSSLVSSKAPSRAKREVEAAKR